MTTAGIKSQTTEAGTLPNFSHPGNRHLKVGGIYAELVGVQRLQRSQGDGQLADVLGPLSDGQDDLLPMRVQVGGARADV